MNDINEIQTIIILIIIIILIKHIELEELLIASYSIEQEEEDFNILPLILLYSQHNKEINELRKLNRLISNYWFNEVCLNMQDFEFKRHFRLTRSTFEWLCCEIIPLLRRNSNEPSIIGLAWEQKIAASLWFLATEKCFRSIGEKFGMGESTISYALRQFFDVIISKFLSEKIIFPTTELEVNRITNGFKITRNFPNVIGAIDGSHIPIKAPHLFPVDYFNRKGFYSIVLQAVVDHKKKFLDICVGWPGSTHDSRILINSNLYNKFNNQVTTHLNNKYILGDEGYLNLSWLIVPYKDIGRGLTQEQTYFNRKHSQTRIKVEQAFSLLKGRWQCLLNKLEVSFEIVSHIITTCCILHNICEERCDFLPPDERYHEVETETDVNRELNTTETPEGNVIRNSICNFLWNQRNTRKR
ncbi:protein ANTAGONIST OF LIKE HETEROCHROMATIN PROTEIN 1-like [Rhizophagus clarus]|uniref:Protein ANTAGONIST OF LIKE HETEROCHROMATIN PROTEIN 1-like n=1 Tax=Rhizophagus clarus TaxID=94130 RepID=A0A8H3QQ54_9GLOM|nr:protein ANTAGONIST OF LIKE HETEROCHROMATIN PROTEIN 1-like [Rhizophagus clarus]